MTIKIDMKDRSKIRHDNESLRHETYIFILDVNNYSTNETSVQIKALLVERELSLRGQIQYISNLRTKCSTNTTEIFARHRIENDTKAIENSIFPNLGCQLADCTAMSYLVYSVFPCSDS
jgi:hypothetical protein